MTVVPQWATQLLSAHKLPEYPNKLILKVALQSAIFCSQFTFLHEKKKTFWKNFALTTICDYPKGTRATINPPIFFALYSACSPQGKCFYFLLFNKKKKKPHPANFYHLEGASTHIQRSA